MVEEYNSKINTL